MLSSKIYTKARIKRSLLYSVFGITQIEEPKFTILLGADKKGLSLIKRASKDFKILTKHSDAKVLSPEEKDALEKSYTVDKLYYSLLKEPMAPCNAYKYKPFIK